MNDGTATSPYKHLLLLSMFDAVTVLSPEEPHVPFKDLGRQALRILWPQVRPYHGRALTAAVVAGELEALKLVAEAQVTEPSLARFLGRVEHRAKAERLAERLGWLLAQWPLARMQTVRGETAPFLFDVPQSWRKRTSGAGSRRPVPQQDLLCGHGQPAVELLPGAGELLYDFGPLLRPLLELRYAAVIGRSQEQAVEDAEFGLLSHLFPPPLRNVDREEVLAYLRPDLDVLRCFWCERAIRGAVHVDHVLPWSATRNDAVENLVLADRQCNGIKSDRALSPDLLQRFVDRLESLAQRPDGWNVHFPSLLTDLQGTVNQLCVVVARSPAVVHAFHIVRGEPQSQTFSSRDYEQVFTAVRANDAFTFLH